MMAVIAGVFRTTLTMREMAKAVFAGVFRTTLIMREMVIGDVVEMTFVIVHGQGHVQGSVALASQSLSTPIQLT
jgi:cellobiose-specific phosphotransferase system component IIA